MKDDQTIITSEKDAIYYKHVHIIEDNPRAEDNTLILAGVSKESIERYRHEQECKNLLAVYTKIKEVLGKYLDVPEGHKTIISLWIIASKLINEFETFPYLFLNAMRGSGKTRTIKLITKLAGGNVLVSITEPSLFRTKGTLGIDEFERLDSKDKKAINELLNASYKKGIGVMRMKKTKTKDGEEIVPETFYPYRPIVMANISGMPEVLGDRCISLVLEKSNNFLYTMLVEDFESNSEIKEILDLLFSVVSGKVQFVLQSPESLKPSKIEGTEAVAPFSCFGVVVKKNTIEREGILKKWNDFIYNILTTPIHYSTLNNDIYTQKEENETEKAKSSSLHQLYTYEGTNNSTIHLSYNEQEEAIFRKIYKTGLDGRSLELWFPLFVIASNINEDVFEEILNLSTGEVKNKKMDDLFESKDINLYQLVSGYESNVFYKVRDITNTLSLIMGETDKEWLNSKWVGKALKRLNLVKTKRRLNEGIEVQLNVEKARLKRAIFE